MTVRETIAQVKSCFVGFYEEDEQGNPKPIYPEYADEILETHGDKEVQEYQYVSGKRTLVIELVKK